MPDRDSDAQDRPPSTASIAADESLEALWSLAVHGDGQAFAAFYRRHNNAVFSHCMMHLRNPTDAEDATAETFALAWRRRADVHFHPDADVLPWLLVAANNTLRHHKRSQLRRDHPLQRLPPPTHQVDMADDVADRDTARRDELLAHAILEGLRSADREIIEMVLFHDIAPAQVAAASGVPAGTVRARLSRALTKARRRYDALTRDTAPHPDPSQGLE